MADSDFLGTGWAFPVSVENGEVLMSSGNKNISESIRIILGTPVGERVMLPAFGSRLNELVFAPNSPATHSLADFYVREALQLWEPRIEVAEVSTVVDPDQPNVLLITVNYVVRETNVPENLVYPFYLE